MTIRGMTKRALGALLWFAAVGLGFEILWSVTGAPRLVGPGLALLIAILVTIDPTGHIWAQRSTSPVVGQQLHATHSLRYPA